MATIVCQGSQSCLESQILEQRTLRLRLSSSKSHFSQPLEFTYKSCFFDSKTKEEVEEKCQSEENRKEASISTNADLGCWSFLQNMSNGIQLGSKETIDKESTYVHPLINRSMSTLSEKSLEICTESLGSETGTDMIEDSGIFSLSSSDSEGENSPTRKQQRSVSVSSQRQLFGAKKASYHGFPPPLTTIRGLESLQVRSHREDGRLIVKATKAPPPHSLLQAERSNGRLRLCFWPQSPPFFDSKPREAQAHTQDCDEEEIENDTSDHDDEEEEQGGGDDEEIEAYKLGEDKNGNILDVGAEMGMTNFQRPGRCKEGEPENKGLLNWESFWVATS